MSQDQLRSALSAMMTYFGMDEDEWSKPVFDQARSALATQQATQGGEPGAWAHEDDPARVISATQKAQTLRDGGASASSVRPYSVALYTAPPPTAEVTDAMVTAYLEANDQYWRETDALPHQNPSKWRNGTTREATRVSLIAALQPDQAQAGKAPS